MDYASFESEVESRVAELEPGLYRKQGKRACGSRSWGAVWCERVRRMSGALALRVARVFGHEDHHMHGFWQRSSVSRFRLGSHWV